MKGILTAAMAGGVAICLWFGLQSGGENAVEPEPTKPEPTPVVVTRGLFAELAERIDAKQITTSDQFALVVKNLHEAGDLTDADLTRLDAALPGLTTQNRPLTSEDAAKLRSLE